VKKNENKDPVTSRDQKRLVAVAIFIFFAFSLLVSQFYKIQIAEGEMWSKKAENQHFFFVTEPFVRGKFFSNTSIKKGHPENPQPFVVDIQKYHLYVDPLSIPVKYRTALSNYLIEALEIKKEGRADFRSHFDRKTRSRKLEMWLDEKTRERVLAWWKEFAGKNKIPRNALYFVNDYQRSYPFGKMLGQVLHTIQTNKDEVTKQAVPTGGLEYYFNEYLKGKLGKRRLMRSPRHSFETGDVIEDPENGADIYLTINHCLQAICEEEIEAGVRNSKAKSGWAVMMDPRTGQILALAQYPSFNPTNYQDYFTSEDLIDHTRVKAVSDAHEPASVMKAFTIAAALLANDELIKRGELPLFDPMEKIATANGNFPGRTKPIKDTRLHYYLNMDMAVQKSSNIYMGRLVERIVKRLGNEWYRNVLLNTFGFGIKTGVELPSESVGMLPMPGKKHPNGKLEWSVPTPFSLAMGYNLRANSLQLLRGFAVFANGGYLVKPTLVRKIVKTTADGRKDIIEDHTSEKWLKQFPRVVTKEIAERVVESLKYVTKPGGGAWRADVWGYTEAGKTGTQKKIVDGQYSNQFYCPSFLGFVPATDPAFIMIVVIDEPDTSENHNISQRYYGSVAAAPVFRSISKRALEYLGIPPDDPHGYPTNDPRYDAKKADWLQEAQKLEEKYQIWNSRKG
jgi:cell division protein FtsI (penicillin-binding protein 3)